MSLLYLTLPLFMENLLVTDYAIKHIGTLIFNILLVLAKRTETDIQGLHLPVTAAAWM